MQQDEQVADTPLSPASSSASSLNPEERKQWDAVYLQWQPEIDLGDYEGLRIISTAAIVEASTQILLNSVTAETAAPNVGLSSYRSVQQLLSFVCGGTGVLKLPPTAVSDDGQILRVPGICTLSRRYKSSEDPDSAWTYDPYDPMRPDQEQYEKATDTVGLVFHPHITERTGDPVHFVTQRTGWRFAVSGGKPDGWGASAPTQIACKRFATADDGGDTDVPETTAALTFTAWCSLHELTAEMQDLVLSDARQFWDEAMKSYTLFGCMTLHRSSSPRAPLA